MLHELLSSLNVFDAINSNQFSQVSCLYKVIHVDRYKFTIG